MTDPDLQVFAEDGPWENQYGPDWAQMQARFAEAGMRALVNDNRRAEGRVPQCPCCEGDPVAVDGRDLCATCRFGIAAAEFPHGCRRPVAS